MKKIKKERNKQRLIMVVVVFLISIITISLWGQGSIS